MRAEIFVPYPVYYNQTHCNEVKYNKESTFNEVYDESDAFLFGISCFGSGWIDCGSFQQYDVGKNRSFGARRQRAALPDQNNTVHKLEDSKGKIVVLAFYPADMTSGCSLEAHNFTKALDEFKKRGVILYGISVQDVDSKKKFCEKDGITYPLLADVKKDTSRDYGVLTAIGVARRVTFVIDKKGTIAAVDPSVKPATVVADTLKMVDEVIAKS